MISYMKENQVNDYIPTMMTAREIAEKCNVPYNFVRNLCVKKKIVFVEAGRKRLINLEKFVDFLNGEVR